ncbi:MULTISPECIES: hypothetical protein [Pseudomonas]|jgi:hypothetical protein|uniref:Uncharacterized protein n=1 Tax=Pseudomonas kielensis TaxID=2762577 RepID=A0A7X1GD69_9PSED|nr:MULTISPECIES: hypothetical protein [Pseudomonas]MBC2690304.1 hypothetical protein [Pseudomonas kielensis]NBB35893.1 hypothetical protein [Pseudomonas sp. BC115LW]UZM14902.1 hypothetical protein LZV00_03685 [Pseudomonas kielensis]WKL53018.1 hypothetical protein Q1W70_27070 [Pseudomonas kielensis]
MANHTLLSRYHAVRDWSREAVHQYLHWMGPLSWKGEATFLLSVSMALMAGYLTVFSFASHAVQDLVDACTVRLEVEFENAEMYALPKTLPRSLCECVTHSLLDKNGMVRLAMLNQHMLDPMALEPVTQQEEEACIKTLWLPHIELAKGQVRP